MEGERKAGRGEGREGGREGRCGKGKRVNARGKGQKPNYLETEPTALPSRRRRCGVLKRGRDADAPTEAFVAQSHERPLSPPPPQIGSYPALVRTWRIPHPPDPIHPIPSGFSSGVLYICMNHSRLMVNFTFLAFFPSRILLLQVSGVSKKRIAKKIPRPPHQRFGPADGLPAHWLAGLCTYWTVAPVRPSS